MAQSFDYTGKAELDLLTLMHHYNRHIARLCSRYIKPSDRVLDFGAGTGTITELVAQQSGAQMDCFELDAGNIAELRRKNFTVFNQLSELPDHHYAAVISSNVLEHVEHEQEVLREIYRAMKPGGVAAFWVPAFHLLWTRMDDRVCHCRRYTRRMLEKSFRNAGFEVRKSFYQDSLGFFITLLAKLVEKIKPSGTELMKPDTIIFYDCVIFPLSKLCDYFCAPFFGKNAFIYARKPG